MLSSFLPYIISLHLCNCSAAYLRTCAAPSMAYNFASENSLLATAYALLGLCSLLIIIRAALRTWQRKFNVAEDCILFTAYLFFLVMTVLYVVTASEIYGRQRDETARSPWNLSRSLFVRKAFFTNNILFWCCLWAIKLQFLAVYRRVTASSRGSLLLWWSLVALCGLVGSSYFGPCP